MKSLVRSLLWAGVLAGVSGEGPWEQGAAAQEGPWFARAWQSDDGLPDNNVTGIIQTPEGYLWVATHGGLARFDGVRFQRISLPSGPGMPRRMIRAATQDGQHAVWLALEGGVVVSLSATATNVYTSAQGLSRVWPLVVTHDGDGSLWIGYADGTACRINRGQVRRYTTREGLKERGGCWLATDAQGRVWFAKAGRVGMFQGNQFVTRWQFEEQAVRIAPARTTGLWICAGQRLLRADPGRDPVVVAEWSPARAGSEPSAVLEDRSGSLWVGTSVGGLLRLAPGGFEKVETSHEEILALAEDREGNLWVGTGGGGLNRLRPRALELQGAEAGLPFEIVRSICEDASGTLWIAELNGTLARREQGHWMTVTTNRGWCGSPATCVVADPKGTVWIGTQGAGLHRWRDDAFTAIGREEGLGGEIVRAMLVDSRGDLWLGLESPNVVQRWSSGRFETFTTPLLGQPVRAITEDATGKIWLGTGMGLLLSVQNGLLSNETPGTLSPALPIRCLHATPDGSVWIGYAVAGLGRLREGRFSRISTDEGLHDDYISQILSDDQGWMWMGGNRGISQVRQAELDAVAEGRASSVRVRRYGRDEALPNLQASYGYAPGSVRSRDGRLWFPMLTGLAVVHPDRVTAGQAPPPVLIERVLVDDRTLGVTADAPLPLRPGHRRLAIEFTALSFSAPENLVFRYRLEGLDDDWVEAGAQRSASYSRLSPGDYRFEVTACHQFGEWSTPAAALSIAVTPFVWQQWWFRIGAGGTLLAGVAASIRRWERKRVRQRVEYLERQHAIERERIRIARDIHDELGAGLTQIGLLADLGHGEAVAPEQVREHLEKIQTRARGAVTALDEIVWAVNPRNDNLTRLADYLCRVADDCFEAGVTRCRKEVPTNLPPRPVTAELRHNLILAVKEALTNALRHAGARTVWLRLTWSEPELVVTVEDDGCGFDPRQQTAQGNGLRHQALRMKDIGGEVEVESVSGRGARVRFRVVLDEPT